MVEEVSRKVVTELRCVWREQTITPNQTSCQALCDESIAESGLGEVANAFGEFSGVFRHGVLGTVSR